MRRTELYADAGYYLYAKLFSWRSVIIINKVMSQQTFNISVD